VRFSDRGEKETELKRNRVKKEERDQRKTTTHILKNSYEAEQKT
jgi:hypothetical protein